MERPPQSIAQDKTALKSLYNVSKILNTGLTIEELIICVRLCEKGINPNMLADIVREMKKEVKSIKEQNLLKKE